MIVYPIVMFSIVGIVILFLFMRFRSRIRIRIKTPVGEKELWRKPNISGDSVTVFKKKKKRAEWKLGFSKESIYFTKKMLMKVPTIDTFAHSKKAFDFDYSLESVHQPKYDKDTMNKWLHSSALDKYAEGIKDKLSVFLIVTMVLVIIILVFQFINLIRSPF